MGLSDETGDEREDGDEVAVTSSRTAVFYRGNERRHDFELHWHLRGLSVSGNFHVCYLACA